MQRPVQTKRGDVRYGQRFFACAENTHGRRKGDRDFCGKILSPDFVLLSGAYRGSWLCGGYDAGNF